MVSSAGGLVRHQLSCGRRRDFVGEKVGCLRGRGAARALDRKQVLFLAADAEARGDIVRRLDHRHVYTGDVKVASCTANLTSSDAGFIEASPVSVASSSSRAATSRNPRVWA